MVSLTLYGSMGSLWYSRSFMVSGNLYHKVYVPCIVYGVVPLCIYVMFLNFVLFRSTSFL